MSDGDPDYAEAHASYMAIPWTIRMAIKATTLCFCGAITLGPLLIAVRGIDEDSYRVLVGLSLLLLPGWLQWWHLAVAGVSIAILTVVAAVAVFGRRHQSSD